MPTTGKKFLEVVVVLERLPECYSRYGLDELPELILDDPLIIRLSVYTSEFDDVIAQLERSDF